MNSSDGGCVTKIVQSYVLTASSKRMTHGDSSASATPVKQCFSILPDDPLPTALHPTDESDGDSPAPAAAETAGKGLKFAYTVDCKLLLRSHVYMLTPIIPNRTPHRTPNLYRPLPQR